MDSKPLVLVTATRKEMQAALCSREYTRAVGPNRPVDLIRNGRELVLLVTGIGLVNAALSLGRLLGARPDIAGVVNLGIAGSFVPENLPIGSPVVVGTEIWPEFGLYTGEGLDPRGLGLGHGRCRAGVVWDKLDLEPEQNANELGVVINPEWAEVKSLTVAGVSGTPQRAHAYLRQTGADVENMEGFALAWACVQSGLPFFQLRTISNRVGSREAWDMDLALSRLGQATNELLDIRDEPLPGMGQ